MVLVVQEEEGEGRAYVIWRARQMHDAVRVINLATGKVEVQDGGDEGGKSCHLLLSSICVPPLLSICVCT